VPGSTFVARGLAEMDARRAGLARRRQVGPPPQGTDPRHAVLRPGTADAAKGQVGRGVSGPLVHAVRPGRAAGDQPRPA
jgi:hypothetical protein